MSSVSNFTQCISKKDNKIISTSLSKAHCILSDSDNIHEDLAELTCEISIKQRLIEELEQTQRRIHAMKAQYEEKVSTLMTKIRETESERDKVLSNLGKSLTLQVL